MDSQAEIENAELAQIYASAPVGLLLLSPDLVYLRINERLAEINGFSPSEHIGKTVADIVPDLAPQAAAIRDGFLAGGGPVTQLFSGTTPAQPGVQRQWLAHWSPMRDAHGTLTAINISVEEVTEQRRQEERAALLLGELRHRLKNTLAVVQSIAHSSFAQLADAEQPMKTFEGRLQALSHAHDMLLSHEWKRAEVGPLVHAALGSLNDDRYTADGPVCFITPDATMSLTLALHELCTNAVKYGALSNSTGSIAITWQALETKVEFVWAESGGPPVRAPDHEGFGTKLLGRVLAGRDRASKLEFRPSGLICRMALDRDAGD